jgi:hypothetical protein
MNPTVPLFFPGLLVAVLLALAPGAAQALTKIRQFQANAASLCQPALPAYEVNVRKRPLALQNEGGSDVFVTCAFTSQYGDLIRVSIAYRSLNDAAATVSCTGITGTAHPNEANHYVTRSSAIPVVDGVLQWSGNDYDTGDGTIPGSAYFSVSCKLPPGVGITSTFIQFAEDVGD